MYMSVQIQFYIIDKFRKFWPDFASVLKFLTKSIDIIYGNLFKIYEGFSKRNALFSPYIFTPKLQQLQIMKSTECTEWGLKGDWLTTVQPKFLILSLCNIEGGTT